MMKFYVDDRFERSAYGDAQTMKLAMNDLAKQLSGNILRFWEWKSRPHVELQIPILEYYNY